MLIADIQEILFIGLFETIPEPISNNFFKHFTENITFVIES